MLVGRVHWGLVDRAEGDRGLDQVILANGLVWRMVDVNGRNPDVDTAQDLESLG